MSQVPATAPFPIGESDDTAGVETPRTSWLALGVVLLAVLAYVNTINHPFLYDDIPIVLKNPAIRSIANIPTMVGISEQGFSLEARWTRLVTHTLEYALVGEWAPAYHRTNIALHAFVGLLVFALVSRLARDPLVGAWAAALFVVHPINTEVVAHISGRRDLLAALFTLSAFLLLERYVTEGGRWRILTALVAFYLAVFSKEMALLGPPAFVLVDLYGRFRDRSGSPSRAGFLSELRSLVLQRRALYGTLAVFTIALGLAFFFVSQKSIGLAGSPSYYDTSGTGLGFADRARLVGLGIRMALLPLGQSVDYSYDALGLRDGSFHGLGWADLGILVAACALTAFGLFKRNWAGFAGAWFAIFFFPYVGIVPWHEIFAERFLYLPVVGICAAVAVWGVALARSGRGAKLWTGAGVLAIGLLGTGTLLRNDVWASSEKLWESAVERYPASARAHKALADYYMSEVRVGEALEHFEEAVRILPQYRDAHVGIALAQTARMDLGQAMKTVERIIERWPNDPKAWNLKGYLYQTLGDSKKAMEAYQRAVENDAKFAEGYNNMAQLYLEQGDIKGAIRMYNTALEHDPSLVVALRNLATVYREAMGDKKRAERYEQRAAAMQRAR